MGKYIGVFNGVEISSDNTYYNFKPLAEIINNKIIELDWESRGQLLPESQKRDIYFEYNKSNPEHCKKFENVISGRKLMVFEFETEELLAHFNRYGDRNPTGYKVQAIEMIDENKIRPLSSENAYLAIQEDEIESDFSNDSLVNISPKNANKGDLALINIGDYFAGPYEIFYRDYSDYNIHSFYIKPRIKENKYITKGYDFNNINITPIHEYYDDPAKEWIVCMPQNANDIVYRDEMQSDTLIESFLSVLSDKSNSDGKISIDDIPSLINTYKESVLSGEGIPESIRDKRISQLNSILSSHSLVTEVINTARETILNYIIDNDNQPEVEEWFKNTFNQNPELIDRLKETKAAKTRIFALKQDIDALQAEADALNAEIKDKKESLESRNQVAIEEKSAELIELEQKINQINDNISEAYKELSQLNEAKSLTENISELKNEEDFLREHTNRLRTESDRLEIDFQRIINTSHEKIVDLSFDGFMANRLLQAASTWEAEEENKSHKRLVTSINNIIADKKSPEEVIDYLCDTIHIVRPTYSKNTILNIAICLTQGFLTVFSGEPGCGKTSICNIFGEVLGLNKIADSANLDANEKIIAKRYLPVSVERGWTSKRDFVGYYNPLSKTFDKTNRRVYEALHQLSTEKELGIDKFPFFVLLDEANLSPMEYYWSDFMNICDDLGPYSEVNLGENNIFGIPETLRFVATINNDHTTETLSPRLIDRSWIITLPLQNADAPSRKLNNNDINIISWESLINTFMPQDADRRRFSEVEKLYEHIINKMREQRFYVSPRNSIAIKDYWAVASKVMEKDETQTEAYIVALDYAVAQKLLPKIIGNGEDFKAWLEDFRSICSNNELNLSAMILQDIIARGNQNMQYYQFFY